MRALLNIRITFGHCKFGHCISRQNKWKHSKKRNVYTNGATQWFFISWNETHIWLDLLKPNKNIMNTFVFFQHLSNYLLKTFFPFNWRKLFRNIIIRKEINIILFVSSRAIQICFSYFLSTNSYWVILHTHI